MAIKHSKEILEGFDIESATRDDWNAAHIGTPEFPIKYINSDYLASKNDRTLEVDASSGDITISLRTAAGFKGKDYIIKKIDTSSNKVIIDPFSDETIDLQLTLETNIHQRAITVQSDGTNWITLDNIVNILDGTTGHDHDGTDSKKAIASNVINTPAGNIAATDVQAAINELDTDISTHTLATQSVHGFDSSGAALPQIHGDERHTGGGSAQITTINSDTLLDTTHYTILVDTQSGNVTITLPNASTVSGKLYHIKKVTNINNVIIDPYSTQMIDDLTTKTISVQWETITIQSNGNNWFII